MSTNRCHKFLLIWKEGKYQDRYFKLHIDPATESGVYELLQTVHNRYLLGTQYINGIEEQAIQQVSTKLGIDGWSDGESIWAQHEITAGAIAQPMGWDRVFVTGIAPYNY